MQIRSMTATFGKLNHASVQLQPGLNIIYAPNESGKSTWCHFIRTMLYGLPTRDRGALADKNRFAPWDGSAMRGRMDVEAEGQLYTIIRDTQRATSPMGAFSCTYTNTATEVSHLAAQGLGESLLGVGREVFVRSAFIGQSGLSLDQDAELERRITALISSGQEDISFSESYDRLKKQLNRRKHNKTGLIPAVEAEIAQLSAALAQLQSLQEQSAAAEEQLQQFRRQAEEIQQRLTQWEALQKQDALRRCLQAEQAAQTAAAQAASLSAAYGTIPSAAELSRLDGSAAILDQTLADAQAAGENAAQKQQAVEAAHLLFQQHALYPADESQLHARLSTIQLKRFSPWAAVLSVLSGICGGLGLWWFAHPHFIVAIGAGAVVCSIALLIYNSIRLRRNRVAEIQRNQLQSEIDNYLQLQHQYRAAQDEAEQAAAASQSLRNSCREGLLQLLGRVQIFAPQATNLTNVRGALESALKRRAKLDQAQQAAREAQLQAQLLRQHLPSEPLPDPNAVLPRPATGYAQLREALPHAIANAQTAQSRLDVLSGQLRAGGSREVLEERLAQKEREMQQLQQEYDALFLAMETLEHANLTMQNRFSPALGQRAAEIFSAFTGGKYEKVLLHRDFSLSAEPQGDMTARSIRLLSQGAADQLYLAVRLAICDMVLPAEKMAPIILDDALTSFDDTRLATTLDWLIEEGKRRQILLFTCQKREGTYLAERANVHHLSL